MPTDPPPDSPVVAAVAAALRAYYGDAPYPVVPVGGAAYAAIHAATPLIRAQAFREAAAAIRERVAAYDDATATDDERNVAHGLRTAADIADRLTTTEETRTDG